MKNSAPNKDGSIEANLTDLQVQTELYQWLSLVSHQRDKQAFTELFQFFAPKIKRFGMQRLGSNDKANELVQETMSNVWRKAHLYDGEKGAATTWVYTVMRNACFDMLRRIKTRNEQLLGDDIWPVEQALAENNPESETFSDHLMEQHMREHINKLPSSQQTVVKGVYFQSLSQEQLAQQLDVPLGTIKSRLRLALARLKLQMRDEYHD
ncbi:sigma-70 region 2 [Shewanella denitrificans OS217]|jgi:RNA polymerase sigma factor (sigma-70 family)|uniref:Sigma-70 region 2 n=2 Tax=Shewanella TaxID=22 RepID=Q12IS6_SHEDO|nr:sigma-70 region 2 [Shewanella denitrificans OS217]